MVTKRFTTDDVINAVFDSNFGISDGGTVEKRTEKKCMLTVVIQSLIDDGYAEKRGN